MEAGENAFKALVTGGMGFIGSRLVDRLQTEGWAVTVIDTKLGLDILEEGKSMRGHDAVFHLAAMSRVDECERSPEWAYVVNVTGTERVLTEARGPAIFASSAAVYGDRGSIPLEESMSPEPVNVYGRTKAAAESVCKDYPDVAVLRLFNVYGPGGRGFVDKVKGGRKTIYGDGGQTRDFIHVDDVVDAMLAANGHEGVFNIGTGLATRIIDIVREPAFGPPRPADIRHSVASVEKAKRELGWTAKRKLSDYL